MLHSGPEGVSGGKKIRVTSDLQLMTDYNVQASPIEGTFRINSLEFSVFPRDPAFQL